ncbi:MAG: AEC family transporter [Bacillota bacterium]
MPDNFIFSLSMTTPIFLVMGIGYILKITRMVNDDFVKAANRVIYNVALPIKLCYDVAKTPLHDYYDAKFIGFIVLGIILSVVAAWLLGVVFIKNKSQLGAFIQGSFRGNFIYIGLSLMESITGSIGLKAPLAVVFIIPLYNILAVIILTFANGNRKSEFSMKSALTNISKNPLIIGVLLGIILSQMSMELPVIAARTMTYFKEVATPLALLTIGASFNFKKSCESMLTSLLASGFKLVLFPLAAVGLAIALGFNHEDVLLIYIVFGVPTAITSYIMTAAMNGDQDLASNIVIITTLLSVVTMTIFIFAFKTTGIIG